MSEQPRSSHNARTHARAYPHSPTRSAFSALQRRETGAAARSSVQVFRLCTLASFTLERKYAYTLTHTLATSLLTR